MRPTIIKRVLMLAGLFFLLNLLLLRRMKSSSSVHTNDEPEVTVRERVIDTKVKTSAIPIQAKKDVILPIVIFGCNRPRALQKHIEALLQIRKDPQLNPIIVSLGCNDDATKETAKSFGDKVKTIIEMPDLGPFHVPPEHTALQGYYRIARHYGYSLNYSINALNYQAIIVTEDDLELSPDFIDYFTALYGLMLSDPTIWCISAWNDNGIDQKIDRQPTLVHRTDFFPGLGWLLTKTVWNQIKDNWPQAFWDDWMRRPEQRRDRACIRPEVSRTGMSPEGKKGVSGGQFYDRYLRKIIKNNELVDWKSIDLNYLRKEVYDQSFESRIESCPVITVSDLNRLDSQMKCAQLRYSNQQEFVAIADALEIMNDFKSGVPRTAYRGVVQCRHGKTRIYVTSNQRPWKKYDINMGTAN